MRPPACSRSCTSPRFRSISFVVSPGLSGGPDDGIRAIETGGFCSRGKYTGLRRLRGTPRNGKRNSVCWVPIRGPSASPPSIVATCKLSLTMLITRDLFGRGSQLMISLRPMTAVREFYVSETIAEASWSTSGHLDLRTRQHVSIGRASIPVTNRQMCCRHGW